MFVLMYQLVHIMFNRTYCQNKTFKSHKSVFLKMSTLEYYCEDGSYVNFNKYTIDTDGVVRNKAKASENMTHSI